MPIYVMSLFRIPKGVKVRLGKIQRDFLWGGGTLERKPHIVNWGTVCMSEDKGGLGIRNLSNLNMALLSKWTCRFAVEGNSPWKNIIRLKYGTVERWWFTRTRR